jgi:DNA repair ATPase RecN
MAQSQSCKQESLPKSDMKPQGQSQPQVETQSQPRRQTLDWYEMNGNLKRLQEERIQHWKRPDEQYAKIHLIQSKIRELNNQLNDEMKLLKTILDKSPALYGLNLPIGNTVNNTGTLTKP